MSDFGDRSADRFMWGVSMPSHTVVFLDDTGADIPISMPPITYYAYTGSEDHSINSYYDELASRFNSGVGETISFSAATPSAHDDRRTIGIEMTSSIPLQIDVDSTNDLALPFFGIDVKREHSSLSEYPTTSAQTSFTFPHSVGYQWNSWNLSDGQSSDRRRYKWVQHHSSSDDPITQSTNRPKERDRRFLHYEWVPAQHMLTSLDGEVAASQSEIAINERFNAFETLFHRMTSPIHAHDDYNHFGGFDGADYPTPVYFVPDGGDTLEIPHTLEEIQRTESSESLMDVVTLRERVGYLYDIGPDWEVWIK